MEQLKISDALKEKIGKAKDLDEVVQLCCEEGIEITKEQLEAEMLPNVNDELSEDTLDAVSGGGIISIARIIVRTIRTSNNRSSGSGGGGGSSW